MLNLIIGCVQHHTPPEPVPIVVEIVDFSLQEADLEQLLRENEDRDAQDRLYVIQDLLREAKSADPETQQMLKAYIDRLIAIEQRALSSFDPLIQLEGLALVEEVGVQEFQLEEVGVIELDLEAGEKIGLEQVSTEEEHSKISEQDLVVLMHQLRAQLSQGEAEHVLAEIARCSDRCWPQIWPVWADARDSYVAEQRLSFENRYQLLAHQVGRAKDLSKLQQEIRQLIERYPNARKIDEIKWLSHQIDQELKGVE